MSERQDRVDAVIEAFLDHLEGTGERPSLDHLTDGERQEAEALMKSLEAARGIDPYASRPSIELLLAGTRFEELLHGHSRASTEIGAIQIVHGVLADIDGRARVEVDYSDEFDTVVYSYLDLRVRFLLVEADASEPFITEGVRRVVERILDTETDTSRVGVVAAQSDELITQILGPHDLGRTITAPNGSSQAQWEPALSLALAVRRMLEKSAPEWDPFDFDPGFGNAVDVAAIALEYARRLIAQEAARRYQGEKGSAYRSLLNQESLIGDLVALVFGTHPGALDLDAEVARIAKVAA